MYTNMAVYWRSQLSNFRCWSRAYSKQSNWQKTGYRKWVDALSASAVIFAGGAALWFSYRERHHILPITVHALSLPDRRKDGKAALARLTPRERRFVQFASCEYGGQLYMTPQDFLESIIEAEPRPRLKRRILLESNLTAVQKTTPGLSKGSCRTFRDLGDQEPKSGFHIAFNMFDTDGNARVDKTEFLVLIGVLSQKIFKEDLLQGIDRELLERIFSHAYRDRRGLLLPKYDSEGDEEVGPSAAPAAVPSVSDEGLQKRHELDTTLLVHLFGKKGQRQLTYEEFSKFMENLQTEVLELEFLEFSKGLGTITELDFAKIILRYSQLDLDAYDEYLERLLRSDAEEKGITFQEFHDFCTFLNNLEDFAIAMRMYSLADRPVSEGEFHRAVKICTGTSLSRHVVRTVFLIFDQDGDGRLSDREFIAIMRDRVHRGLKSYSRNEGWDAFKHCIKQELKSVV